MLLYQQLKVLSEIINTSLSDGETGERVDEPIIDGGLVERIEFVSPWKIVVVLKNGVKIAVESDVYGDVELCETVECVYESTYLKIYVDG